MAILDRIDDAIRELKPVSKEELDRMSSVLKILNDALAALKSNDKLISYNFDMAINLVNQNVTNFGIIDLTKGISDIKNVLMAKKQFGLEDLELSDEQNKVINSFKEKLESYKRELENLINKYSNSKIGNDIVENITDLKRLSEGKGRRKYYTYEMLESLLEVVDYDSLSYQEMKELSNLLSTTKNKDNLDSEVTKEEVIDLLKEYLGDKVKVGYIERHGKEICSTIDLENARKILEFFKKEDLLKKFGFMGLVLILMKGRYEFISKFYYNEILTEDEETRNIFFDDTLACVWVNEKRAGRRYSDGIRESGVKEDSNSICGKLPEVTKDDVINNIHLLEKHEEMLDGPYDKKNIKDLYVLTKPTWLLEKNLLLFREFCVYHVKPTAIAQTDLEDKINLAVELGLLNSPRNKAFKYIETTVPRYREFDIGGNKKGYHESILNYFRRNTSQLGSTSYAEYVYWFYRMQRCGKEEFYKIFFSDKRAGTKSKEGFDTIEDKNIYGNAKEMNKIIDENFANNFYSQIIENYRKYVMVLKEFSKSPSSIKVSPYFDRKILDEDIVREIEEFRSRDYTEDENNKADVHVSSYAYVFGQTIVSRYKVLRNLTILKNQFGYINEDMLLTAVAYKSYLSRDVFDTIRESLRKGMVI